MLDATNPWEQNSSEVYREARRNGVAQKVANYLPDARLVRVFISVDATVVATSGTRSGDRIGMLIASDDAKAIAVAVELVREAVCDPLVVGNLASAVVFKPGSLGFVLT